MENPASEIRNVVRKITEPRESAKILASVDRYFSDDSVIVHPMLNSPRAQGKHGVKAAYRMLRALTLNNKIEYHAVAFEDVTKSKGGETRACLIGEFGPTCGAHIEPLPPSLNYTSPSLDLTEHLQLRFLPVPEARNPVFHVRFLVRVDLRKGADNLWYITKQEDNIPTDPGSSGLLLIVPPINAMVNTVKWFAGMSTMGMAAVLNRLGVLA
ncbi:BQ5605_C004g02924 [Microbotryum silenes-dioicae]|uniref:BQ5605_C004g02924 protein n=1 Tax=Microbotryum silenes-dioicae TaxID=796604 RepID=A0A2X0N390_9BASI|nr:BQ5605_C004g02924 [Microbotryum silenes-dioicae]